MKKRLRKYLLSSLAVLLISAIGAGLYVRFAAPIPLEEAVMRAQIDESGPQAQAALLQYPNLMPRLFALYGEESDFKKMMFDFGHNQTFPIIGICFEGGDSYLDLEKRFGDIVSKWFADKAPETSKKFEPQECGKKMIENIITFRNDFLQRFAIDSQQKARRLDSVTALSSFGQFTTGGFQRTERKMRTGEEVTLGDIGEVGLDTLGLVGIAKLVLLPAKLGLVGVKYGLTVKALAIMPKAAVYTGAVAMGYVAIKHPAVVTGIGGKVAEGLGYSPVWGQALIWFGPTFVLLFFLNTILFWVRPLFFVVCSPFKLYLQRKRTV